MSTTRYTVSGASAGVRDGKRFSVWDREQRRSVEWFRTFKAAQQFARKMNNGDH